MTRSGRSNRFAHLAALAVFLLVLAPGASHFVLPALLAMAIVLVALAVASQTRRGPV